MKTKKLMIQTLALFFALVLCLSGCGTTRETEAWVEEDIIGGDEFSRVSMTEIRAWTVGEKTTVGGYSFTAIALEEDSTLLLCDTSVATAAFNDAYENATWGECSLRTWLNGEFLATLKADKNFDSSLLITATVVTEENPISGTGAGTSVDSVFLLSAEEIRLYGNSIPTVGGDCWIRTTGEELTHALVQKADGSLHLTGYRSDFPVAGVRPCIRVSANNAIPSYVKPLSEATVGGQVAFGNYGGETLVWDVLAVSGGKALVMTDKVIDAVQFNAANGVAYADSAIASWLNGTFKNDAFSAEELGKINTQTAVVTLANPNYGTEGGRDSAGIFVLSAQEYSKYCTTDATKLAEATEYAKSCGADVDPFHRTAGYWLRTPGMNTDRACYVKYYGAIEYDGAQQVTTYLGVRPAMWVTIV